MTSPETPFEPEIDLTSAPAPITRGFIQPGSIQLLTGAGLITCVSYCNVAATAALRAFIRDGNDATGEIIAVLAATAAGGDSIGPGSPGIYFKTGLFLSLVSGLVDVSITYLPLQQPL